MIYWIKLFNPVKEQLISWGRNKNVSEFAVLKYLEGLKLEAKELSLRGFSGEEFRLSLINHSNSRVKNLLGST